MKLYKIMAFVAAFSTMGLFASCTDDLTMTSLPVSFEEFNGGSDKAYINGHYACWENGDGLRLSKTADGGSNYSTYDATVSISYNSGAPVASASASGFSTNVGDVVYGGFPASYFNGTVKPNTPLILPDSYNYEEVSDKVQRIFAPMVGKVEIAEGSENRLLLKNLCCMLRIKVDKPTEGAFILDQIALTTESGNNSPLCGAATVAFNGDDPSLVMGGGDNTVRLNFGSEGVPITETRYFYIPIPPLPAGEHVSIYLHNQMTGNWKYNTVEALQAIPGNSIATIQGPSTNDVSGPFTLYNYLENNGNCMINLGVNPTNTSKMQMTFRVKHSMAAADEPSGYYSGARKGNSISFAITGTKAGSNREYLSCTFMGESIYSKDENNDANSIRRVNGKKYSVTCEVKLREGTPDSYYMVATFDELDENDNVVKRFTKETGDHVGGITSEYMVTANTLRVFAIGGNYTKGMQLYSYKVWQNDELMYNFVPAKRNEDDAVGVYNMVHPQGQQGEFMAGSGSFVLGNDPSSK